jgi:hypothetical protein
MGISGLKVIKKEIIIDLRGKKYLPIVGGTACFILWYRRENMTSITY